MSRASESFEIKEEADNFEKQIRKEGYKKIKRSIEEITTYGNIKRKFYRVSYDTSKFYTPNIDTKIIGKLI